MVMDNSGEIFEVTAVRQSQKAANSMMDAFVQRSERVGGKRGKTKQAMPQRKKVKKTKSMDITSFFKQ